jgi:6-phosphogluconolactonase
MTLKPEIVITSDSNELARAAVRIFQKAAKDAITQKDHFAVALSGGSTPRHMNRMLAQEPHCSGIAWDKIQIFWVDERCVSMDDPASNYGVARKDFLDQVPIPIDHVHPMPGEAIPEEGARIYQSELKAFFRSIDEESPVFDLILLGIGTDGHTASLFPGTPFSVLLSKEWVLAVKGGTPDVYRLTLTYDVLNRAKEICFLVSGEKKAPIVKSIFENEQAGLPAQKIQPLNGRLTWLMDRQAGSLLSPQWGVSNRL